MADEIAEDIQDETPVPEPAPEPELKTGPVQIKLDADVWRAVVGAMHGKRDARIVEAIEAINKRLK